MKVDPINLILENRLKIDTSFYFVSGNEVTLMQKIKDFQEYQEFLKRNEIILEHNVFLCGS